MCIDLLGHGDSDRPAEMWNYSMPLFGEQVLALMDHLELEKAVLGGTSLGANATLEAVAADQDRVQGMLIEMPVLDNALLGCAIAFTPLLLSLTFGAPVTRAVGRGPLAGAAPRARCSARCCWTGPARIPSRPPRCSRGCSSAAPRRRARSAGRWSRRRW